jgi:hypothetical protein
MLELYIATVAALCSGLLGGVVGWWLRARYTDVPEVVQPVWIDPMTSAEIDRLATAWAQAHDRPQAEELVADKLRLAWMLRHGQQPSGQSWSW